ncbi:hypothetical protein ACFVYR_18130 [Streptomyces sp. NPDC058284]|uniref:hypothetical protein n=1 Tax=unclassified Streptomyces TaxID=2593676 RepID=UPI003665FBF8
MKYGKRLAGGVIAASALLGTVLATAPTVSATSTAPATSTTSTTSATPTTTSVASAATFRGTAPACVKRDVIKHKKYVKVTNHCGQAMHLKVVIDWGNDSPCLTYQNNEQWEWTWGRGSYGKVVTC